MTERGSGKVYLVGAGPGDVGLLTVRGAEVLARADLVVHDGLVNPALLRLAPATAERIAVGRQDGVRILDQSAVNRLLVEAATAGRVVVRLKGGDPYVFGRGGEEAEALHRARRPYEVVPGVSSFHAAAAYAGIPIADESIPGGSAFLVVSGQEDPTKPGHVLDWAAIAATPGTKIILMGVERLPEISRELLAHGVSAAEPAAIVRWGTTPKQTVLRGSLGDLARLAAEHHVAPPAAIVIGPAAARGHDGGWFERRPLFRSRIVVTRARDDAEPFSRALTELGAEVWEIPAIRRAEPDDPAPAEAAIEVTGSYDWIVFTSAAGVAAFFERFLARHGDLRALGNARLAAVGPATAASLRALRLRVDAQPARFIGREVARAMQDQGDVRDLRVLLARAQVAGAELAGELEKLGALVDDVAFYRTTADDSGSNDPERHAERLTEEGADWITFTSASTVEHFHARYDLSALLRRHPRLRFASIGPETSRALVALGWKAHAEAEPHTTEGLVAALVKSTG